MNIALMIAACLAACLVCLDAFPGPHGGGGGGRGGPRGGDGGPRGGQKERGPRFSGTYYTFTKSVDANTTFNQTGFILNGSKIVIVSTRNASANSTNIAKAKIIHNFNNESNIFTLIVPDKKFTSCFILITPTTNRTFEEVKATLDKINNTKVEAGETIELIASSTPLTAEERTKYYNVSYACGRRPIVPVGLTDVNATSSTGSVSQITVVDLNNPLRITYPQLPARPYFPGGPESGRPAPPRNRRPGGGPNRRGNFGGRN